LYSTLVDRGGEKALADLGDADTVGDDEPVVQRTVRPLKVAYVTRHDPEDVVMLSGSVYYVRKALESAGLDVIPVAPLETRWPGFHHRIRRAYARIGKQYRWELAPAVVRHFNRQADEALRSVEADVIFSPETIPVCRLRDPRPLVFYTDATFDGLLDYYAAYTNLCRPSLRAGHAVYQAALSRCTLAVFTSEWAVDTALRCYKVDPAKLRVVPLGANLPSPVSRDQVESAVGCRDPDCIEPLFIGREWMRKGGPVALQVVAELARRGQPARLTLMGRPREIPADLQPLVRQTGHLRQSDPEQAAKWREVFSTSHFLVLPTQAECFSYAAAEACAFGVPVIATRTGGLPEVVKDGVNGQLLGVDASVATWCDQLQGLVADKARYRRLCMSARDAHEERLNWRANGERLAEVVHEAVDIRQRRSTTTTGTGASCAGAASSR
jgi:glycosyltransferase involved in cell wall biosynthesis